MPKQISVSVNLGSILLGLAFLYVAYAIANTHYVYVRVCPMDKFDNQCNPIEERTP